MPAHAERLDRPADVLQRKVAQILEGSLLSSGHGFPDVARHDDAARWSLLLQARGDIHVVAVEVVVLDDDVADVDADPEGNGVIGGLVTIGFGHSLLELDGGGHRVDGARELDQAAVAGQPDHAAIVACGERRESSREMLQQPGNGAALVPGDQPGRSDHVCEEDCRQPATLSIHRTIRFLLPPNLPPNPPHDSRRQGSTGQGSSRLRAGSSRPPSRKPRLARFNRPALLPVSCRR